MADRQPAFKVSSTNAAQAAEIAGRSDTDLRRDLGIVRLVSESGGFIGGHYPFSLKAWTECHHRWKFITVLREPVDRWFSHYFYSRYRPSFRIHAINEPLEQFIDSERAVRWGRMYPQYLSDSGDVDEAVDNLDRFDLVGTLERLPAFVKGFERSFGIALAVGHRNKNPLAAEHQRKVITPSLRARVEELCEPDRRVYEHAVRIGSKLSSMATIR